MRQPSAEERATLYVPLLARASSLDDPPGGLVHGRLVDTQKIPIIDGGELTLRALVESGSW